MVENIPTRYLVLLSKVRADSEWPFLPKILQYDESKWTAVFRKENGQKVKRNDDVKMWIRERVI